MDQLTDGWMDRPTDEWTDSLLYMQGSKNKHLPSPTNIQKHPNHLLKPTLWCGQNTTKDKLLPKHYFFFGEGGDVHSSYGNFITSQ